MKRYIWICTDFFFFTIKDKIGIRGIFIVHHVFIFALRYWLIYFILSLGSVSIEVYDRFGLRKIILLVKFLTLLLVFIFYYISYFCFGYSVFENCWRHSIWRFLKSFTPASHFAHDYKGEILKQWYVKFCLFLRCLWMNISDDSDLW